MSSLLSEQVIDSHATPARPSEVSSTDSHLYQLALRGDSLNPMIDAATPLLGMVLRVKDMPNLENAPRLYQQVTTDVRAIEQLLQSQGYEPGAIVSFRYVLCTFIDEVAMGHGWNSQHGWVQQSLLVHFHNEAWGGEKVFVLLDRLMGEPKRYQDLLEFIYLCFCLGFRGRYKVATPNGDEFSRLFRQLSQMLQGMRGEAPFPLLHQDNDSQRSRYRLSGRLTVRHLFWGGVGGLALVYVFYLLRLQAQTQDILLQLNKLLN